MLGSWVLIFAALPFGGASSLAKEQFGDVLRIPLTKVCLIVTCVNIVVASWGRFSCPRVRHPHFQLDALTQVVSEAGHDDMLLDQPDVQLPSTFARPQVFGKRYPLSIPLNDQGTVDLDSGIDT
jgi:hypothetical protein